MLVAAYRRLIEERPGRDGEKCVEVPAPAAQIVGALAVEIAMKAVICRERGITQARVLRELTKATSGHGLSSLFSLLTPAGQQSFCEGFEQWTAENREVMVMTDVVAINQIEEMMRAKSFEEELALASDTFVEWRYSYEFDFLATNTTFMRFLISRVAKMFALAEKLRFYEGPRLHKKMTRPTTSDSD